MGIYIPCSFAFPNARIRGASCEASGGCAHNGMRICALERKCTNASHCSVAGFNIHIAASIARYAMPSYLTIRLILQYARYVRIHLHDVCTISTSNLIRLPFTHLTTVAMTRLARTNPAMALTSLVAYHGQGTLCNHSSSNGHRKGFEFL